MKYAEQKIDAVLDCLLDEKENARAAEENARMYEEWNNDSVEKNDGLTKINKDQAADLKRVKTSLELANNNTLQQMNLRIEHQTRADNAEAEVKKLKSQLAYARGCVTKLKNGRM